MQILLDTHVLLLALDDPQELNKEVRKIIASEENVVFISVISLWELCIKESINKITLPSGFFDKLQPAGFEILPITIHHLKVLKNLPMHHRDPFDRLIIAQAKADQLTLLSRDVEIHKYKVELIKA